VSGDGLHVVQFEGSDGSTATRAFVIDTLAPRVPVIYTPPLPEPATYTFGQLVFADYRCRDSGSGIRSCDGTVSPDARPTANATPLPTNRLGTNTLTVQGTDLTGHVGPTASRTYKVNAVFSGFFTPVDNPTAINVVAGGQSIPIKFSIGGDGGLNILAPNSPSSAKITCDATAVLDDIEQTTTANSGLSFGGGQYLYVWKTDKAWRGTCRRFTLKLADGVTTKYADFLFK
jgi:hypothetical protein